MFNTCDLNCSKETECKLPPALLLKSKSIHGTGTEGDHSGIDQRGLEGISQIRSGPELPKIGRSFSP